MSTADFCPRQGTNTRIVMGYNIIANQRHDKPVHVHNHVKILRKNSAINMIAET